VGDPSVSNLNVQIAMAPLTTSAQYVGGIAGYTRNTAFSRISVSGSLNVTQNPNTPDNFNVGGVTGFAASSSFTYAKVELTASGVRTVPPASPVEWEIWRGGDTLRARAVIDSVVTETGEDGVTTGGVAGYVKNSQFSNVTVIGDISATGQTQGTPVYVGGITGFATGTNIDDSWSTAEITGAGPGYNTSAGGLAGYVSGSRVRNSYAEGDVYLSGLSVSFGWGYSWQVYAGGLIGYVGGSDAAPSLVDHSYATGDVYASAPYPYSGGLIGYLYGFNDFINPAKNGSTVKESYATGTVTAESQTDEVNNIGDIPYAGGLVGYSSVAESTIKDSYATGDATARTQGTFAWAGGIVGGNANDALVLRTYATGTVTSETGGLPPLYLPQYAPDGPAAGGIAGFNYYTANTLVSKSVALNGTVDGNNSSTQDVVHRIAGSLGDGTGHDGDLNDNYANFDMYVGDYWIQHYGPDDEDGADVTPIPPQSLYTGLGWDFNTVWQMTGNYPTLR
jgi:hypothetical protein